MMALTFGFGKSSRLLKDSNGSREIGMVACTLTSPYGSQPRPFDVEVRIATTVVAQHPSSYLSHQSS